MTPDHIGTAYQFTVGSVLGRTFSTLFSKPVVFFIPTLVGMLPLIAVIFLLPSTFPPQAYASILVLALLILRQLIQGTTIYAVYQVLRGNAVSLGESVSRGIVRLATLCFASVLIVISYILLLFLFSIMNSFLIRLLGNMGVVLSAILCGFLFIKFTCMWSVTMPSCVVERLGATASMGRSMDLTKEHRMKIFGLVLIDLAFNALLRFIGNSIPSRFGFIGSLVALILFLSIPLTFSCVMYAIVYYDLRAVKEGVSIDDME